MLELPTEVWEHVIDHLWEDHPELLACSLVCKAWRPRSCFHLLSRVFLHSRADVYRLVKSLKSLHGLREQVRALIIRGDPKEATRKSIPQLGTLATSLASSPPCAEELGIWHARWQGAQIQYDVFLHLTTFVSVTKLTLAHVTFPKVLTFGRLIFALPRLETLACRDVAFDKKDISVAFHPRKTNIIDFDMLCGTPMDEVVEFLIGRASVVQGLEQLHVAWWDPAPLLKELKTLRVKSLIQAASDSLTLFDIRLGGVDLDPVEASAAIGELDLSSNTNLSDIRLTLQVPPIPQKRTVVHSCMWLHTLLTTITSKELTYLTLDFDMRALDSGTDHVAVLGLISMLLASELSSAVDALLAGDRFENLECVYLGLFCAPRGVLANEEDWTSIVQPLFPRLKARGLLHVSVDIDLER